MSRDQLQPKRAPESDEKELDLALRPGSFDEYIGRTIKKSRYFGRGEATKRVA